MLLTVQDKELLEKLRATINARLNEFSKIPKKRWQREVALCLLTPQSSPQRAEKCIQILESRGLFAGRLDINTVSEVLRTPSSYVRFHNVKAQRLIEFIESWKKISDTIVNQSPKLHPCIEREILLDNVKGFGMKEASHALRNIGRRGLTILDRHILRYLHQYDVINEIPKTTTKKRYIFIEELFKQFADRNGESVDVLDLLFWFKGAGEVYK